MSRTPVSRVLLILSPLLLLLLFEGVLRVVAPQPPRGFSEGLFEKRESLSYLIPGAVGTQYSREFRVRIREDGRGYRSGLSRDPQSPDAWWILGDSFGFGWGVEAERTASGILAAHGQPVRNCAMPGDGLRDYQARLRQETSLGSAPGRILVLLYDNDIAEWTEVEPDREPALEPPSFRLRQMILESHLLRGLGRLLESLGLSGFVAAHTGYNDILRLVLKRDLELHRKEGREFGDALAFLEDFLRIAAIATPGPVYLIRVVPVYAAGGARTRECLDFLGEPESGFDFAALDRQLAGVCSRAQVHYARFAPHTEREEREWYFTYDMHLTAEGQRALAEYLIGPTSLPEAGVGY
jgi:hypothetical protein